MSGYFLVWVYCFVLRLIFDDQHFGQQYETHLMHSGSWHFWQSCTVLFVLHRWHRRLFPATVAALTTDCWLAVATIWMFPVSSTSPPRRSAPLWHKCCISVEAELDRTSKAFFAWEFLRKFTIFPYSPSKSKVTFPQLTQQFEGRKEVIRSDSAANIQFLSQVQHDLHSKSHHSLVGIMHHATSSYNCQLHDA